MTKLATAHQIERQSQLLCISFVSVSVCYLPLHILPAVLVPLSLSFWVPYMIPGRDWMAWLTWDNLCYPAFFKLTTLWACYTPLAYRKPCAIRFEHFKPLVFYLVWIFQINFSPREGSLVPISLLTAGLDTEELAYYLTEKMEPVSLCSQQLPVTTKSAYFFLGLVFGNVDIM